METINMSDNDTKVKKPRIDPVKLVSIEEKSAIKKTFWDADNDALFVSLDVAIVFGVSSEYLQRRRCDGEGPEYTKHGRKIYYKKSDCVAHFSKNKLTSTSMEATL